MVSWLRWESDERNEGCGGMLRARFARAAVALVRIWVFRAVRVEVRQRRAAGRRRVADVASIVFECMCVLCGLRSCGGWTRPRGELNG